MAKPVILAVDDPQVLRAVEWNLRRRYYLQKPWYPPVGRLPLEVGT